MILINSQASSDYAFDYLCNIFIRLQVITRAFVEGGENNQLKYFNSASLHKARNARQSLCEKTLLRVIR